jgi:hypothetical protein
MGDSGAPLAFEWSATDEPHASRRQDIIKKHAGVRRHALACCLGVECEWTCPSEPCVQVNRLNGPEWTAKYKITVSVLVQIGMAWLVQELEWPWLVLCAYTLGGIINHSLVRVRACTALPACLRVSVCACARTRMRVRGVRARGAWCIDPPRARACVRPCVRRHRPLPDLSTLRAGARDARGLAQHRAAAHGAQQVVRHLHEPAARDPRLCVRAGRARLIGLTCIAACARLRPRLALPPAPRRDAF